MRGAKKIGEQAEQSLKLNAFRRSALKTAHRPLNTNYRLVPTGNQRVTRAEICLRSETALRYSANRKGDNLLPTAIMLVSRVVNSDSLP